MNNYHIRIFVVLLEHILHSDALVLIKFGRVYEHYLKNRERSTADDPLGNFGLEKRIQLCDDVLDAKQFATKYPASYNRRRSTGSTIHVTKWNLPPDVSIDSLNYQRFISTRYSGRDPPALQYNTRILRVRSNLRKVSFKRIQCVRTKTVSWYVTFGLVDGFMYLLESDLGRGQSKYRLVGILEPTPLLDDRGLEYFQSQYENYRDEMESICFLRFDDYMRFCGAVLDALDKIGSLTETIGQNNYVKFKSRNCRLENIRTSDKVSQEYFLHCDFVFEDDSESSSLFYALADSSERGAAFVFLEGEYGIMELHARLVKIGALVNPTGPAEVQLNAKVQFREGKEKFGNFISWREKQRLNNERDRLRYRSLPKTPRRRSRSNSKSEKTRQITPPESSAGFVYKTRSRDKGKCSRDDCEEKLIEKGFQKQPEEEGGYKEDGLEKVPDSSGEEYDPEDEYGTKASEGHWERKEQRLLELEMIAKSMLADYIETTPSPTPVKNLPPSWGRRDKRSKRIYVSDTSSESSSNTPL